MVFAEGEEIEGPISSQQLASVPNTDSKGRQIHITTRGYKKWYRLAYVRQHGSRDPSIPGDLVKASLLQPPTRSSEFLYNLPKPQAQGTLEMGKRNKQQTMKRAVKKQIAKKKRFQEKLETRKKPNLVKKVLNKKPKPQIQQAKPKATREKVDPSTLLRLGPQRDAFLTFAASLMTFGLFNIFWIVKALKECTSHLAPCKIPFWIYPMAVLSFVPFLSVIVNRYLVKAVRGMEQQNQYEFTKPGILLWSLFPPVLVFKIQKAMNIHWNLHRSHYAKTVGQS